jgi:hypothetical protein
MLIITILGLASMTVLWVNSHPTNVLRNKLYRKIYKCKDFTNLWHWRLINCCLCTGFWVGLAGTWDIYLAGIISVVAEFIYKKLTEGGI